jgi:Protein of unknown function (DUF3667)
VDLPADAAARHCRNCGAPLGGPYCASCGQSAHGSARSLGTLFHDAWHDLTHLDGRLWRTLGALVFRPGRLTSEYLQDRRASYLPPFRLYLVLSIVFFALEAAAAGAKHRTVVITTSSSADGEAKQRWGLVVREMEASGRGAAAAAARSVANGGADAADLDRACAWLATRGGERLGGALVAACKNTIADGGRSLTHAFLANVPKTFFLFLPLVALVLFGLFGRARRYYVEHLVLVLHLQAAMFLFASLAIAVEAAERWGSVAEVLGTAAGVALWGYGAWYAYRSLRVVYGEGRARTIGKLAALGLAYAVLLVVTLAGTFLVSAFYA